MIKHPSRSLAMSPDTAPPREEAKPVRLIRLAEVKRRTGMSTSTIYRWMKEGKFPNSRSIGGRIAVWPESELDEWIAAKLGASNP